VVAGPLQVRQLGSQLVQRKVVWLVNWVLLQLTHTLSTIPVPLLQLRQKPSLALQLRQLVHSWQLPVPLTLKVLEGQAWQMLLTTSKPGLQVRQVPLAALQVAQLASQFAQLPVPSEKVPAAQAVHRVLLGSNPASQVRQ
jgi:hypothetical protein